MELKENNWKCHNIANTNYCYYIAISDTWIYGEQVGVWAPSQYPKRRLSERSRKVLKPRDLYLEMSDRSEMLSTNFGSLC